MTDLDKSSGRDRLAARTDDWMDRQAGSLADHPKRFAGKWIAIILGIVIVLGGITTVTGYALDWWSAGKDIVSVQNVKNQSYNVRENWNTMIATLGNACSADRKAAQGDPTFVEDPALAYAATYRKLRADYNRAQDNPFENGVINAGGYPKHVPVFEGPEIRPVPDWCAVEKLLLRMHD